MFKKVRSEEKSNVTVSGSGLTNGKFQFFEPSGRIKDVGTVTVVVPEMTSWTVNLNTAGEIQCYCANLQSTYSQIWYNVP
jgi:hypothetical protein